MSLRDFWRKEADKLRDKSAILDNIKNVLDTSHLKPNGTVQQKPNSDTPLEITPETKGVFYIDKYSNSESKQPRVICSVPKTFLDDVCAIIVVIPYENFFYKLIEYAFKALGASGGLNSAVYKSEVKFFQTIFTSVYSSNPNTSWNRAAFNKLLDELVSRTNTNPLDDPAFHKMLYSSSPKEDGAAYNIDSICSFTAEAIRTRQVMRTSMPTDKDDPAFITGTQNGMETRTAIYCVNHVDSRILYREMVANLVIDQHNLYSIGVDREIDTPISVGRIGSPKIHTHVVDETYLFSQYSYTEVCHPITNGAGGLDCDWIKSECDWTLSYPYNTSNNNLEHIKEKYQPDPKNGMNIKYHPNPLHEASPSGHDRKYAPTDVDFLNLILEISEHPRTLAINPILVLYGMGRANKSVEIHIPLKIQV
jgi:hypothetical protein